MTVALKMTELYVPTLKEEPAEAEVVSHRLSAARRDGAQGGRGRLHLPPAGLSLGSQGRADRARGDGHGRRAGDAHERWSSPPRCGGSPAGGTTTAGAHAAQGPSGPRVLPRPHARGAHHSDRCATSCASTASYPCRSTRSASSSATRCGRASVSSAAASSSRRTRTRSTRPRTRSRSTTTRCPARMDASATGWGSRRPVEADSGQIGGKVTTEFMALAENGEAAIVYCRLRLRGERGGGRSDRAALEPLPRLAPMERVQPRGADDRRGRRLPRRGRPHTTPSRPWRAWWSRPTRASSSSLRPRRPGAQPLKADRAAPGVALLTEEEFATFDLPTGSLGPTARPTACSSWPTGRSRTRPHGSWARTRTGTTSSE